MEASIAQVMSSLTNAANLIGSAADGPGAVRQRALATARDEVMRAIQELKVMQVKLEASRARAA